MSNIFTGTKDLLWQRQLDDFKADIESLCVQVEHGETSPRSAIVQAVQKALDLAQKIQKAEI